MVAEAGACVIEEFGEEGVEILFERGEGFGDPGGVGGCGFAAEDAPGEAGVDAAEGGSDAVEIEVAGEAVGVDDGGEELPDPGWIEGEEGLGLLVEAPEEGDERGFGVGVPVFGEEVVVCDINGDAAEESAGSEALFAAADDGVGVGEEVDGAVGLDAADGVCGEVLPEVSLEEVACEVSEPGSGCCLPRGMRGRASSWREHGTAGRERQGNFSVIGG